MSFHFHGGRSLAYNFFIKIYILNKLCAKFHAFFHHESEMTLILCVWMKKKTITRWKLNDLEIRLQK